MICLMTKGRGLEVCKTAKTSYEPPSSNIWTHKSKNDNKQQCQYWKTSNTTIAYTQRIIENTYGKPFRKATLSNNGTSLYIQS